MRQQWLVWLVVAVLGLWGERAWADSALSWVFHSGATATGNGNEMPAEYFSTIAVQIEGTFAGEVTFEKKTKDATGWSGVQCRESFDSTQSPTADAPGYWECPGGAYRFRVRVSAYTSGTIVVTGTGTTAVASRGGGGGGSLNAAFNGGNEISGAISAKPVIIGNGTQKTKNYCDPTEGCVVEPVPLGDSLWRIWPNFKGCIKDMATQQLMLCFDPDATDNEKYVWMPGYRPVKSIPLPADALYVKGSAALVTDTPLVSGGLVSPYITVTDSDSDGVYRYLRMPANWDGSAVGATLTVMNTNATPANAFLAHVSGTCYAPGTVVPTTISTANEQPVTVTFGSSGSCGVSACHQNDTAYAHSASGITINGEPAGGNWCGFQAQVDATGTTENVAGIKITQLDIHYRIFRGF